jgi:hypothetical protein
VTATPAADSNSCSVVDTMMIVFKEIHQWLDHPPEQEPQPGCDQAA